jgi:hypothetical protein
MANKTDKYFEDECYKAVQSVLQECKDKDRPFTIKALKAAYPFGERKGRKYKIWNRIYNHAIKCRDAGAVKYAS